MNVGVVISEGGLIKHLKAFGRINECCAVIIFRKLLTKPQICWMVLITTPN